MKKTKTSVKASKKVKKGGEDITTTSVAFKDGILTGIKEHPLHKEKRLSVSWIINELGKKFLAGEIVVEYP